VREGHDGNNDIIFCRALAVKNERCIFGRGDRPVALPQPGEGIVFNDDRPMS